MGLANVVHSPERFQAWRERSPYKFIITVSVAGVLLRWVVGTGICGILWGKFLLTEIHFRVSIRGMDRKDLMGLRSLEV